MADFNTEESYIKILSIEHGELVQDLLLEAGCSWWHSASKMVLDSGYIIHITNRRLSWSTEQCSIFGKAELKLSYSLVDSPRHKTKLGDREYYTNDLLALAEGNGLQEANK